MQDSATSTLPNRWNELADRALAGEALPAADIQAAIECPAAEVPLLVAAAYRVRHAHFERDVRLHMLVNAKSGLCAEDCGYCSQSSVSEAPVDKYRWLDQEKLLDGAKTAHKSGARTFCIVASGRGPSEADIDHLVDSVGRIKDEVGVNICCSLGLVSPEQAVRLKKAGVDRLNHNLNTGEDYYEEICDTHSYADRVKTLEAARDAGLEICSGGIAGMGEKPKDLVSMALHLRQIGADSVPINFLHEIEGTPLGGLSELDPMRCLAILSAFRLALPAVELRIAGGRELHLRSLQSMGLLVANSIFLGDYLTTDGQAMQADHQLIEDLGFSVVGAAASPEASAAQA